ncbi:Wzz/FepE/Etk N-terminal domain-containing protein [Kineococcus arenarius]|uniref:Wzz/FepE/Etk N-terminal domain-containing protein n=1 Tax=Kineococcus sp. SYSU DK007 TaxID=3383128 RepID=UPI003D7DCA39
MTRDTPSTAPNTPLAALAERWWLGVLLAVAVGALGVAVAYARTPTYTGEARVTVGSESLDARVVAGYSRAASDLASDISRYVNDQEAVAGLDPVLGQDAAAISSVIASPIPESSVIRIEVFAEDPEVAARGAQAIAQQLTDQVNTVTGESPQSLLQEYTDLSNQVAVAEQTATQTQATFESLVASGAGEAVLAPARAAAEQAAAALDVLEVQQSALGERYRDVVSSTPSAAGLRVVQEGHLAGSNRTSRVQQYGLAGVALGVLLALLAAVVLDRRAAAARAAGDPAARGGGHRSTSPTTGADATPRAAHETVPRGDGAHRGEALRNPQNLGTRTPQP